MYLAQYLVMKIFIFRTKENEANIKGFFTNCYAIKDTKGHIILVGLINIINE